MAHIRSEVSTMLKRRLPSFVTGEPASDYVMGTAVVYEATDFCQSAALRRLTPILVARFYMTEIETVARYLLP